MWNIDFSGTDGYSDTLSITGTISTEPGTSPYTIDEVDLTYTQIGIPGDPCPGPYEGLGFVLASSGGGDGSGNDVIFYSDEANAYCVPQDDEPWFCGTLTVTPATAPSATPEPGSLGLLGLGMFALPAAVFLRRKIGSMTA